jgi:hypothetical protein
VISFGPWSYLLSFGALNGAAVALLLLRSRTNRSASRLLAALLAVVVLRLVPYIIGYAGYYDAYPWLSFAPFDLPLAMGPLLWLYVVRLTSGTFPPRWRLHLVPALLHLVTYGTIFVAFSVPQKTWIAQHVVDPWVAPAITAGSLRRLRGVGLDDRRPARNDVHEDGSLRRRQADRCAAPCGAAPACSARR